MKDLNQFLKNLTTAPGVYQMFDIDGVVLYVGKAANLKKRVSSYFSKKSTSAKTRSLVSQIKDIQITITRSETEALLLESSLIKSLRPKYNVLLRDDKSYPYIHVTKKHAFPRMDIMRTKRKPKEGEFYGPYPSSTAVRETLNSIQKIFKIRNCSDNYFSTRTRPCLQYQIKRCSAPCTGYISRADYKQNLQDAAKFLQGQSQDILLSLEQRMKEAADKLNFELAAQLRDQIKNLRLVQEQQGIVHIRGDVDVIVLDAKPGFACIQCVTIRDGNVVASQSFFPSVPKFASDDTQGVLDELWQQVFSAFLQFYYVDTPERIPTCIVTNHSVDDKVVAETLLAELRGKNCKIQTKPRGIKAKWLDFALNNLQLAIEGRQASSVLMKKRIEELQQFFKLDKPIERMECYDISHTQGESTVASCVVFDQNGPNKKEYRRFNIQGITPGDDYGAMQQALSRRFKNGNNERPLPDVLIIDGGKGQVAVAKSVLDTYKISSIKLIGVAKGPSRKAGWEQLIIADTKQEIALPPDSKALHLIQHIRDEAHRFAITFHRKRREKASLDSTLETIPGVGSKRRQALMRRFGGIRELAKAPLSEIAKVSGISQELAQRIYQHFHP